MTHQRRQTDRRATVHFLIFGASLSSTSLNVRLAALAADIVQGNGGTVNLARMEEFDCPSYDSDVEKAGIPPGAAEFRQRLVTADAFIVASPEYNASMPGALKTLIDWVSRYRPQPFHGKQALLLSASPSMGGGNRGLWALRIPLEHLGARVYPDMFSLAQAHQAFGEHGRLSDAMLQTRFERTIVEFMDVVEATKHYPRIKSEWVEFLGEKPDGATERVETAEV
jgi:NAD(P)H-dependent FMN reductase